MKQLFTIFLYSFKTPYRTFIWLTLLFLLFLFWLNTYVAVPGLWFVLTEILLFLSIRGQIYHHVYQLPVNKNKILLAGSLLAVSIPTLIIGSFVFQLFNGSSDNELSRWKNKWPIYADDLSSTLRNPDTIPKSLKVVSARDKSGWFTSEITIVLEGKTEDIEAFETMVSKEKVKAKTDGLKLWKPIFDDFNKTEPVSYDFVETNIWRWNPIAWLLYGNQLDDGYYNIQSVPAEHYTGYLITEDYHQEPYVVYFLFSPDRTRVVLYDFKVTH